MSGYGYLYVNMILSVPPSKTRVAWGLSAVAGRKTTKPALDPIVVVLHCPKPLDYVLSTAGVAAQ